MSVLFFWRSDNYVTDISKEKAYYLIQDNELLLNLKPGEHVWAFTRRKDKKYVLAADLVVVRVTNQSPEPKYGRYCAYGDKQKSRYFDDDRGRDAEPVIRSLSFFPAKTKAKALGQLFQGRNGVRLLSSSDDQKLTTFSSGLQTI